MKVALVHDFLNQYGGAERVLEAIHEIFPYAPVYTSLYNPRKLPLRMKNWDIRPFKLPKVPVMKYYTAFYHLLFEKIDLSEYDLVISSSAGFAKGVLTGSKTPHIAYIHTPPRFLYHYETEVKRRDVWIYRPVLAPLDNYFRIWDYTAAQRPDFMIANSKETAGRIKKFYGRDATVIYPPVSLEPVARKNFGNSQEQETNDSRPMINNYFRPEEGNKVPEPKAKGSYFLVVSRLAAYKRIDLAIEAANRLKTPLKIVGVGREEKRLKKMAGPTVKFLGFVSDEELSELYLGCQALIFPTNEDFGITPIEAMSFGKPVMALAKGGALETVVAGKTGEFFAEETVDSLVKVWKSFDPLKYKAKDCIAQAKKFSKDRFKKEFSSFVDNSLSKISKV